MLILFPTNYRYLEQTTTFIADPHLLAEQATEPGGCANIVANFLIQFFDIPYVGLYITLGLLLIIAWLTCSSLVRIAGRRWSWLGIIPSVTLLPLHYILQYSYYGTVAMLFCAMALRLTVIPNGHRWRLAIFASLLPILYFICGPMPYSYPMAPIPNIIYVPWIALVVVIIISILLSYFNVLTRDSVIHKITVPSLTILVSIPIYNNMMDKCVNQDDEIFKALHCLARAREWDKIMFACSRYNMSNLLFQNYAHLAWAEKGELEKHVGSYLTPDVRALVVEPNQTPHISAMLSEIYYSMGHIALAQRHAFEANEMYGGYSPRMLQLLVKTNIIFGHYKVAEKYIKVLEKTRYRDWARNMRGFLNNDNAVEKDNELGMKRRCIFPDDILVGSQTLADDLKEIFKANPEHRITLDYLNAINKLNGLFLLE